MFIISWSMDRIMSDAIFIANAVESEGHFNAKPQLFKSL